MKLIKKMELISLLLAFLGITFGCDLVPNDPTGSCMDLRTVPLITTDTSSFGPNIEGASVNKAGDIFAVNYQNSLNSLGQVSPTQRLFFTDPQTSAKYNGIRFLNENTAFAADYANHRVVKLNVEVSPAGSVVTSSSVYCTDPSMLQPNDLTLSVTGTVFTSGMQWLSDTDDTNGDIWSCTASGQVKKLEVMGRTNGIDLSPDEKTLYVSESYNRGSSPYVQKIWKYDVNVEEGTISGKTLFADFEAIDGSITVDVDGMKTDTSGNIYVTRHGGRQVVIFNPAGEVLGKIGLTFPNPTNLEFGGPSGTTLFVVGKCENGNNGCTDTIEVSTPGRSWSNLQ